MRKNPFDCIITMWNNAQRLFVAHTLIALLHIHQHFLIDNECHGEKNEKNWRWMTWMRANQYHVKGVNKQHLFSSRGNEQGAVVAKPDSLTNNKLDRFRWNWNWKNTIVNECLYPHKAKTRRKKWKADTRRQYNEVECRTFEWDASIMFKLLFFTSKKNELTIFYLCFARSIFSLLIQTASNYVVESFFPREIALKYVHRLICNVKQIHFARNVNGNRYRTVRQILNVYQSKLTPLANI